MIITGTSLWDQFRYFELTEIMRQREDQAFAIALNNMSEGNMTHADIQLIKSREKTSNEIPNEAIHLFYSNAGANDFNLTKLANTMTEEFISTAKDTIKSSSLTERSRANILKTVKSFKPSETQEMLHKLQHKTSIKYMVTVNISISDGLVNGATGELMQVDSESHRSESSVVRLWIKFAESRVGSFARSKQPHSRNAD
ncbi:hypothetical protein BBW68_14990 [Candidatus Erwinia dacicola]|uniref:Uncharacterized protein n=1 Tax=Candidatus Erwinia dacicola TaxID=252393 RepID=A0A1E7YVS8_9GAMM|nr:hypothetical protein [Candidatus Erwinia dacicola]OFC59943.1 hypothetical protein BBW68_14990 [Candidatus Erwinia dacicola]